jgi:asparagine synthase (glutamine-hydrolysing)
MCGFSAVLRLDQGSVDPAIIQRMSEVIRHRGPDDSGTYFCGAVGMGFRRLSILDITPSGHQPMTSEDGQVTIAFNGEIYNYVELRRNLQSLGHSFRSTGDTEVLLHAYRQWGAGCLERLNGMWAFLIFDKKRGVIFGSRDRFGLKPLYRYSSRDYILFGSEIKAIRASGLYAGGLNQMTTARYLLQGQLEESPDTFYSDIEQIPAGTAFEVNLQGRFRQWKYWSLEAQRGGEVADPAAAFAELFEDAIRLHMRSDVAVGVTLSGGLDSTSIICATARLRPSDPSTGPLLAFCYQAPEFDESVYIADTLRQVGATLLNLEASPRTLWSDLCEMLWHQDEPVHSMTAVIGYQLMRLAAENGVKVILTGQGADETIGGYEVYFRDYWYSLLTTGRMSDAWDQVGAYALTHGGHRTALFLRQLRHQFQVALRSLKAYRQMAGWAQRRRLRSSNTWFDGGLIEMLPARDNLDKSDLRFQLRRAVEIAPLPLYLRVDDRNSMAHSVEARLPFLDYRLVSLVSSLAPEWHLRGPWNKFVLRESMRGLIPESVRLRADKMGFPHPARDWFANELNEPVFDILRSRAARERGLYNLEVIMRDAERHRRREIDVATKLFRVAQFELFCTLLFDGSNAAQ